MSRDIRLFKYWKVTLKYHSLSSGLGHVVLKTDQNSKQELKRSKKLITYPLVFKFDEAVLEAAISDQSLSKFSEKIFSKP